VLQAAVLPRPLAHARTPARGEVLQRLAPSEWLAASVVTGLFGAWAVVSTVHRGNEQQEATRRSLSPVSALGSNSISLPKPRE